MREYQVDKRINKIQLGRDINTKFEGLIVCLIDDWPHFMHLIR